MVALRRRPVAIILRGRRPDSPIAGIGSLLVVAGTVLLRATLIITRVIVRPWRRSRVIATAAAAAVAIVVMPPAAGHRRRGLVVIWARRRRARGT
jgi:hypothetical protein